MSSRADILKAAKFGSRIAEDEIDELNRYFVETEHWRRMLDGDVDVVFGAKGAGKSALYALLVAQRENFRTGRRTVFLAAENPRGTPAFRDLTTEPPMSEEQFRGLWKLYFLSICAHYMRVVLDANKQKDADAAAVISVLSANGLLAPNLTLVARLKAALSFLKRHFPSIEGSVSEPSGMKYSAKITLAEPTAEQRRLGFQSLDDLLRRLNTAYERLHISVWLFLDRLDVAFAESSLLEGNALRSLFRTYLDMIALSHIKIKIFLRDDIWGKIVQGGFREASHITRTITIGWDKQSLLNLIVRRLLSNESICQHFNVDIAATLASAELQEELFYKVFPPQVEIGLKKLTTLDWMVSRTADGSLRTAPRELIHLLLESRDQQLRLYQLGTANPSGGRLFDNIAISSAFPAVSKARYEQTLCAENPTLKSYLDKLDREKSHQSIDSLCLLWKCERDKASAIAERLVEVGFFERRGAKDAPTYWVPFLYRDVLKLLRGSA